MDTEQGSLLFVMYDGGNSESDRLLRSFILASEMLPSANCNIVQERKIDGKSGIVAEWKNDHETQTFAGIPDTASVLSWMIGLL